MLPLLKRILYPFMGLLMLFLAGCESPSDQSPTPENGQMQENESLTPEGPTLTPGIPVTGTNLVNTQWVLESFGEPGRETSVIAGSNITLELDENGQAKGSGGCNTFGAQYAIQNSIIVIRQLISTKIACKTEGVMEREQRYFRALQTADRFELTDERLTIHYDSGAGVLNFVRSENAATQTPVSSLLCSSPDQASNPGWQLCRSQKYNFEIQYPPTAELIDQTEFSARINLPFPQGVNLTEKYLSIAVTEDSSACSSPLAQGRAAEGFSREPVQVNGLEFIREVGEEAATGSIYNWEAYSTSRDSQCISLSFVLRSFRPELEATPPPRYDPEKESQIFTAIISTFKWLDS